MAFNFQKLEVYKLAIEFAVFAKKATLDLPRGNGDIRNQLQRASTSIVLNIAEGAGKIQRDDKRKSYAIALGSTTECAAAMELMSALELLDADDAQKGSDMARRIEAMLVKLDESVGRRTR